MKPILVLAAILFVTTAATAQKTPFVTDRPMAVDPKTKESHFLECVYDYYEEPIKTLPSGDDIKPFGYFSFQEHSSIQTAVSNDSIEVIIRLKAKADFSKFNFTVTRLTYTKILNRREVIIGYKKGITRIFAAPAVRIHVQPLDDDVYAITIPAKNGDEFALFFGPLTDGVPRNKMYCVSAVSSPIMNLRLSEN
jgi:hypothetical protein